MNALADETTVKGDFSGRASISYRGGKATFYRRDGTYQMDLERGAVHRRYQITQTIGSRFFQYYIGKQIEGPEPKTHQFYTKDHVLQLGYWLGQKEWVPIVHVGTELPELQRPDPFDPPARGGHYAEYAVGCNYCHTTFPLGDLLARQPDLIGTEAPTSLHWSMREYLEEAHPDMVRPFEAMFERRAPDNPMASWEAPKHAVTLGVSCEACHLGAREHVQSGGRILPKFFPSSRHLWVEGTDKPLDYGRTHDNVNWACGRCHIGNRPLFAGGMSTWNSVEYTDAMRGSCYSKLRCIDCHNPHQTIGPRWSHTADQDDAKCLKCHDQLRPAAARVAHTHHPIGSEGARCMNCHMPRINEGLEDVVRTHMIYSPTQADMIEANHPNACNICHTDKSIDWTLGRLKDWYGKSYNKTKISAHYPDLAKGVGGGWLDSDNPSVRLVGIEALTRGRHYESLARLLDMLDDPYLINRQFAYKGIQQMLDVRLADHGYRFYMTPAERRQPLADLRARFSNATGPIKP
jgi:predicted CXXCH cytochrome family protein